jgi:phage terminase large subunit GpA-like protein
MTRDDAWCLLSLRCERLGRDELRVLGWIADRLAIGAAQYGAFHLAADRRDWAKERREEALDGLVYAACDALCAESRCDTEPAPAPAVTLPPCPDVIVVDDSDIVPDAAPTLPSTAPSGLYLEAE